jgi:hypothetical protein
MLGSFGHVSLVLSPPRLISTASRRAARRGGSALLLSVPGLANAAYLDHHIFNHGDINTAACGRGSNARSGQPPLTCAELHSPNPRGFNATERAQLLDAEHGATAGFRIEHTSIDRSTATVAVSRLAPSGRTRSGHRGQLEARRPALFDLQSRSDRTAYGSRTVTRPARDESRSAIAAASSALVPSQATFSSRPHRRWTLANHLARSPAPGVKAVHPFAPRRRYR